MGIRGTGILFLHTVDDGGETEFQGRIAGTGDLPGVWEGVTGGTPPNQHGMAKGGSKQAGD